VDKDMVVVVPCGTNLPNTDKQNAIGPRVYKEFEREVSEKNEGVNEKRIVKLHG
jgi:hypothetical protein